MDRSALSLPILLSLVIGNMIGTGIYTLPASLAQYGSYALVAWAVTSTGAIFFALTLSSLNKRYPKTGGLYVFCRQAYGRMAGFIVGYLYWVANLVSIAGLAVASVAYMGYFVPALNASDAAYSQHITLLVEVGIVWIFTSINIIGIHTAGVVQLFLTIAKVIPLLLISLLGLGYLDFSNLASTGSSQLPAFSAISSAAALTFWAFIGIESATIPAENTKGAKDIFRATVYGTCITSFIYILSTFVLMGMFTSTQLQNTQYPFALAGNEIFGPKSAYFIAACAVISGLGALNVTILIQGQIVFAAARDKLFPKQFSKLSKHDVPVAGQLLSSSLVSLLMFITLQPSLLDQFNYIALLASLFTLMAYLASALSEIKFLHQDFGFTRKLFRHRALLFAVLASIYCGWMLASFTLSILCVGAFAVALFALAYILIFHKHVL